MDPAEKEILIKAVNQKSYNKFLETFNQSKLEFDETFFDYDLLTIALERKQTDIAKFLLSKGCRVRNPYKTYLDATPLHLSMKLRDLSIITTILNKDTSIYEKNFKGETPLYAAFLKKNFEAVNIVLDFISISNLSLDPKNRDDVLHFHIACVRQHMSSIKLYLSFGFDVNSNLSIGLPKYCGLTPMLWLVSQDDYDNVLELVQEFINHGVDVNCSVSSNCSSKPGYTSLHFAVRSVYIELVELLLKNGADSNKTNIKGKTPLHVACKNFECDEALRIIEILVHYSASPIAADYLGNTPIHLTFSRILHHHSDEANILNTLIAKQSLEVNLFDKNGLSFFHIICTKNEPDLVNNFLNSGVNIDSRVTDCTMMYGGFSALHFAVLFNQKAVVEVLLQRNASVDIRDEHGNTPLHLACEFERVKFYEVYSQYKNARSLQKPITVDWLHNRTDHLDIIKLLLSHGADVNAKNKSPYTPLFTLCMVDKDAIYMYPKSFRNLSINEINIRLIEIVKILLINKASINRDQQIDEDYSLLDILCTSSLPKISDNFIKCLINAGADINAFNKKGLTPLHTAVSWHKANLVQTFLKHKANVNIKSRKSQTALQMAISLYYSYETANDDEIKLKKATEDCIITLLENGSDVNIRTKDGKPLLHDATLFSTPFVIEKLLYYGADINMEDASGNSIVCSLFTNINVDNVNVLGVIFIHVQKLTALGLYVSDKLQNFCIYFQEYCKANLQDTCYSRLVTDSFNQCENELNRMKRQKIDNYTSLYHVLLKDPHELSKYVKNQRFMNVLKSKHIDKRFPLYSFLLKPKFRQCLLRSGVMKYAKESLKYITDSDLPDLCYDLILRYLTNEEIINLKAAAGVKENVSKKRKFDEVE